MRRFYLAYPKWQTVSAKLSWSHYTKLLSISDELSRCVRKLKKQRNAALFELLDRCKEKINDKQEILTLSMQILKQASNRVKEPYVISLWSHIPFSYT